MNIIWYQTDDVHKIFAKYLMFYRYIIIFLLLLFCAESLLSNENLQDSSQNRTPVVYQSSKSPSTAIYRSLILPGLGQIYVESYWKAPIFIAATGTLVYLIIDNQIKFADYDNRLSALQRTDRDYQITKIYREYYRDNRDMSGLYLMAVYILAAVDAYVGAHLYDFQVNDNLSMNIRVAPFPIPAVSLKINF